MTERTRTVEPVRTGATVQGVLVPRRFGWALDRGQFGVHAIDGFFDPFAGKKIRLEIKVVDEDEPVRCPRCEGHGDAIPGLPHALGCPEGSS